MTTKAKFKRYRKDCKHTRRNIYISDEVYDEVGKKAVKQFRSMSAWIEDACREKLEREK